MKTSINVERVIPSGAWRVSSIVGGYLRQRVYYYMSKREAVRAFRATACNG